ncbi:MAG: DNA translocase FtsK [Planctomycetes bacterium]|nr:DNA translocase FtsK [Planctomycetota bacterium]
MVVSAQSASLKAPSKNVTDAMVGEAARASVRLRVRGSGRWRVLGDMGFLLGLRAGPRGELAVGRSRHPNAGRRKRSLTKSDSGRLQPAAGHSFIHWRDGIALPFPSLSIFSRGQGAQGKVEVKCTGLVDRSKANVAREWLGSRNDPRETALLGSSSRRTPLSRSRKPHFWPAAGSLADLQPMARSAPKAVARAAANELPPASFARRATWVALAGLWVFLFLSLGTFHSADWPSHSVAVHNDPPSNLMGQLGSAIAYWIYHGMGFGVWLPMIAAALALGVTASGREITHPMVRGFGAVVMMLAFGALHAAWFGSWGVLPGSEAGLVPQWIASELALRFSPALTSLVLLISLALGSIICMDEVVFALPRQFARAWQVLQPVRDYDWKGLVARLRVRPQLFQPRPALAMARGSAAVMAAPVGSDLAEVEDTEDRLEPDSRIDEEEEIEEEEITDETEEGDDWDDAEADAEAALEDAEEDGEDPELADPAEAIESEAIVPAEPARPQLTEEELKARIARLPLRMASAKQTVARDEDIPREVDYTGYRFPGLDLLEDPEGNWSEQIESYVREQAARLTATLRHYAIEGEVTGIETGPVVTLYSVELAPGTRVARLQSIDDDIARALGAPNIRIISNMVGRTAVGIEVPNKQKEKVRLKELMSGGQAQGMTLPMFLSWARIPRASRWWSTWRRCPTCSSPAPRAAARASA